MRRAELMIDVLEKSLHVTLIMTATLPSSVHGAYKISCMQIEEQKAEAVSRRLAAAGRNLADALYSTHAGHSQITPVHGWAYRQP